MDRQVRFPGLLTRIRPRLSRKGACWALTTLWEKLIKTGARMVRHACYITFQLTEVAVPRELYRAMLRRIAAFEAQHLLGVRAGPT